jgi:hypothetical protein
LTYWLIAVRFAGRVKFKVVGYESNQAINIEIQLLVTYHRAEVPQNMQEYRFTERLPAAFTNSAHFSDNDKAHLVLKSQFQRVSMDCA